MELQVRRQLSTRTLVGITELKNESSDEALISQGIYRLARHPRYLAVIVGLLASALIVNYLGVYLLALLMVPGLYSVAVLEERELMARFGQRYRDYASNVPRLFPTVLSLREFRKNRL
jgi:protein-S-isoprenylcysteine O-methyltransferase Ste14